MAPRGAESIAERIRILRVIARLNVGGPAIHVTLASMLDPARYETRLLAGDVEPGEGDMEWFARDHGIAVEKVPGLGREIRAGGDVRALAHLRRVMREWRPRIVHTHTAKAGTLGRIAAILSAKGGKRVHTFHGHVLSGYFAPWKERVFRTVERSLAKRTHRLVVPSARLADELAALGVGRREQYSVIPLGFELEPFLESRRDGAFRKELGIPEDAVLVGIVGRLTAIKNHEMFLRAAARLKRRTRHPLRFVLVGDGELRGELERSAKAHGIADLVSFAGWRKDLAKIYPELDVVALTSRNEGTPVTLIEAMASGRAVLSTSVGGVPDIVEDGRTGLLVDVGRDDLFAVAIGRLADEPDLRERLARAGREEAAKRFRVGRLLSDLDSLYSSLLQSPS